MRHSSTPRRKIERVGNHTRRLKCPTFLLRYTISIFDSYILSHILGALDTTMTLVLIYKTLHADICYNFFYPHVLPIHYMSMWCITFVSHETQWKSIKTNNKNFWILIDSVKELKSCSFILIEKAAFRATVFFPYNKLWYWKFSI